MKSIFKNKIFGILLIFFCSRTVLAQDETLKARISGIIEHAKGKVGAAIENMENPDTLIFNNSIHYPMQSVFKFPLALAILNDVDKGIFSLDQKIHISKKELHPDTWSPLREKYPDGDVDITLGELITYTVSESDNNGCDILFQLAGGTAKVNRFVHKLGVREIEIVANEEDMHKDPEVQYKNWTTPTAMAQLLIKFACDSILSKTSKDFLWNVMTSTVTGPGRIKGELPGGTIVAHKTGSSGTNEKGVAAATNDAGIITLPNGKHIAIVVLIKDSRDDEKTRDRIITEIAKAAFDYYSIGKD
jgi:beta-lactamase class A